jgi:hypothetical protein
MRCIPIFGFVLASLSGCSSDVPDEKNAASIVATSLEYYGALTEFEKINGEKKILDGQEQYTLYFLAKTRLGPGFFRLTGGPLGGEKSQSEPKKLYLILERAHLRLFQSILP